MAHPYNNKSPFNCWKGYERVPGKTPGTKGSCRKSSPAKATKGGGTTKVCLPKSKVNNMSEEQKQKVIRAKESAGRSGRRERSQQSEVSGARKKGATLKDWFEKENWVNVKTGKECGAPTKRETSEPSRGMKTLKTAWDIGSTFLKGAPGIAATFLTPQKAYAHQDGQWVTNPDGSKTFEKVKFYEDDNDGGLLPKFKEEETPLNIKEEAYEKQNRKMRAEHKRDTGKTLGERQTKGTGKRRVSFACRFAGMKGSMKDAKGEPTRYAMALKKWGFGSREAARNFCNKNKES